MVAPEPHDSVFRQAVILQLLQDLSHPFVHKGNKVVIAGPVLAHHRCVGVVRGELGLSRIVLLIRPEPVQLDQPFFVISANLTLMGDGEVDDGKKGLAFRPTSPVGLATALIPGGDRRGELVVGLDVVGAVVPGRPQVLGEAPDFRQRDPLAAHRVRADAGGIHPGDDPRPGRGAYPGVGKDAVEARSLGSKAVNVGRHRITVTVAAQVGADVFSTDPEEVRPGIRIVGWYLAGKHAPGQRKCRRTQACSL
ncbi:hypothetical protein ES703_69122 [subsurface metagenome]